MPGERRTENGPTEGGRWVAQRERRERAGASARAPPPGEREIDRVLPLLRCCWPIAAVLLASRLPLAGRRRSPPEEEGKGKPPRLWEAAPTWPRCSVKACWMWDLERSEDLRAVCRIRKTTCPSKVLRRPKYSGKFEVSGMEVVGRRGKNHTVGAIIAALNRLLRNRISHVQGKNGCARGGRSEQLLGGDVPPSLSRSRERKRRWSATLSRGGHC